MTINTRLIETLVDFAALADAWSGLPASETDPLLSHDWFLAAASTLHREQRLQIVTVWREQKLVAVAPLIEARRQGTRWLEFIGSRALFEPCNVLFSDEDARAALMRDVVALYCPLSLHRFPADSGLATLLRGFRSGWLVPVRSPPCRRVDMLQSWDSYLATRSRECRTGFPRKRRQLAAGGTVSFESLSPDADAAVRLLDEFVQVEASGWKQRNGSALASRPSLHAFFAELARRFAARGQLRMSFLRCDGDAVAAQLGVQYGNRYWELKVGYDERWHAMSPGRILLWEVLRDSFAQRLQAYEFLGTGDGQQSAWSTSESALSTLVFYPYSARGAVALARDAASSLMRRVGRTLTRAERD
jgi:CelD/BcsL family acetyltransferase involved in cellulose biosynthesis